MSLGQAVALALGIIAILPVVGLAVAAYLTGWTTLWIMLGVVVGLSSAIIFVTSCLDAWP